MTKRLLPLCTLLLAASAAWCQTVTGSLSGVVLDSSGASVPGSELALHNRETGAAFKATSNDQGNFQLRSLPPGAYRLEAAKTGFRKSELANLAISIGRDLRVTVTLEVGGVNDAVSVTASPAAVLENNAQVSANFDCKQVTDMPVNLADGGLDKILLFTLPPASSATSAEAAATPTEPASPPTAPAAGPTISTSTGRTLTKSPPPARPSSPITPTPSPNTRSSPATTPPSSARPPAPSLTSSPSPARTIFTEPAPISTATKSSSTP